MCQLKLLRKVSTVSFYGLTLREDDFDEVASWDNFIKHSDPGLRRPLIWKRNLSSDSRHPIEKSVGGGSSLSVSQQKNQETNHRNYPRNDKFNQKKEIFKGIILVIFRCLNGRLVSERVGLF